MRTVLLASLCCVLLQACTKSRRVPAVASSNAEVEVIGSIGAEANRNAVTNTNTPRPTARPTASVSPTRLTFQTGQVSERELAGYTIGNVSIPNFALNAGVPETPAEWDACYTARANLKVDGVYPVVRLGRKVALSEQGENMALSLYPGLTKARGLLTGHRLVTEHGQGEPCWVGAWEKLSDEAYYDHVTDLTWYLEASRYLNWEGAVQYVGGLNEESGGEPGWRIPTSAEQLSLAAAYEQWAFTRARFGAVTSGEGSFWSADEPTDGKKETGFHTSVFFPYADINYAKDDKAHVLAVRSGRWTPRPKPAFGTEPIVVGQRHPASRFPIPERVLSVGLTRVPELINQCWAAKELYEKHGVFPPVRVTERIRLRSAPRSATIVELEKELLPFNLGTYTGLPPACLTMALEARAPNHFVEWLTGLEWRFMSEQRDQRVTWTELHRALKELNRQLGIETEAWRLPTFVELALFGRLTYAFWDFENQKSRREPVWLSDIESGGAQTTGRLCRDTDGGWIENAQQSHSGRCAALLVRAVAPQPNQP